MTPVSELDDDDDPDFLADFEELFGREQSEAKSDLSDIGDSRLCIY